MFEAIETERLRIRPFRADDCPAVLAYSSDEATLYFLHEPVMPEERAREWTKGQAGPEARAFR
jgi:RimJ/RimL family protein N-acetyltransferase